MWNRKKIYGWMIACTAMLSIGLEGCIENENNVVLDIDECPNNPNKKHPGACGCDVADTIDALTGLYGCMSSRIDLCPNDPLKEEPGVCGCGVADIKGADGIALCLTQNFDLCPEDDNKTLPGICGCGIEDTIDYTTGVPICLSNQIDLCPDDPNKTVPGVCGCGIADTLDEETGLPICSMEEFDFCPDDPNKTRQGICGCGVPDIDSDGDGVYDCDDQCPDDTDKTEPGICGCNTVDSDWNIADNDGDGVVNCLDICHTNPWKWEDDGCTCEELKYELSGNTGCAQILTSTDDFLSFRDKWNAKEYGDKTNTLAFSLVNDINLGDKIKPVDAIKWEGVGTEEVPFNGIFLGNDHKIEGVYQSGSVRQTLKFGNENQSHVGLFGYTNRAQIQNVIVDLDMIGRDYVASIVSSATSTKLSGISVHGAVQGNTYVGGIVGESVSSSIENAVSASSIQVAQGIGGGIVGHLSDSQLSYARNTGAVTGGESVGGIVGVVTKASRVNSVHASGQVSGGAYTGGLAGTLSSRSILLNSYTTNKVSCNAAPCALLIAEINDFSTVKNAYTAGHIVDKIPELETTKTPIYRDNPTDNPENPQEDSSKVAIPIASLIASFASADNLVDMVYYLKRTYMSPIPKEAQNMSAVSEPIGFSYISNVPYTDRMILVHTALNSNLQCILNTCTLDGFQVLQWFSEKVSVEIDNDKQTTNTVTLPWLRIGGE